MSSEFSGLHVVVTGGTSALGRAVVRRLLEAGAHCHIPCFAEEELETFAWTEHERIRLVCPVDLTQEQAVFDFYAGVPELWASIHVAGGFGMSLSRKRRSGATSA